MHIQRLSWSCLLPVRKKVQAGQFATPVAQRTVATDVEVACLSEVFATVSVGYLLPGMALVPSTSNSSRDLPSLDVSEASVKYQICIGS